MIPLVPAWRTDRTFTYFVPPDMRATVQAGCLVRVAFGSRKVRGVVTAVEATQEEEPDDLEPIGSVTLADPLVSEDMGVVLEDLAERYVTPRGKVYDRVVPPRVRVRREPLVMEAPGDRPGRLDGYEGGVALLDAVRNRGAGTWEVVALPDEDPAALTKDLVAASLHAGGSALVLVPEVRYGSRVIEALERWLPGIVRVDSGQEDAARARGWVAAARGAPLVVGGRGAALVPRPQLRLVVVEDAHSRAYKEDRAPRFDARWVAHRRAEVAGAVCVLVSSTPPLDLPGHPGTRRRVVAPRAARRRARPVIQLVEPPDAGLSHELHVAVRSALQRGEKVGLLAPMGGFARAVWCSACRRSVRCDRCEAGMVFELHGRALRCPRCQERRPAPDVCPTCGSTELKMLGAGSERLEAQLRSAFPRARVTRMDPQVLTSASSSDLAPGSAPARQEADIYLTTWVGVKDVLRPEVTTVGVLDADGWIRRPDLRSAENAYAALAEMAAWAGPAERRGRLVIQTAEPGHHAIQAVVRGDHAYFEERESELRRELGYPPFSELVRVRISGSEEDRLIQQVREIAGSSGAKVLGPVPVRVGGEITAREMLLKCPSAAEVSARLRVILPDVARGSRLIVDVDPR